jgi:hypothetical protein
VDAVILKNKRKREGEKGEGEKERPPGTGMRPGGQLSYAPLDAGRMKINTTEKPTSSTY